MEPKNYSSASYGRTSFMSEKRELDELLRDFPHCIENIGQADRAGMSRSFVKKEPLNLMIGIENEAHIPEVCARLQKSGFVRVRDHERVFPNQRYFVKLRPTQAYTELAEGESLPSPDRVAQTHHVHVVPLGCRFWQHHISVKDKDIRGRKNRPATDTHA